MNIEQFPDALSPSLSLAQRAARHSALAEPVRLRIVDLLLCSDLSSSELRDLLGVSSNLLAHHLGVLEKARLVERRQSEGDRRRSYVRLLPQERRALVYEHAGTGKTKAPPSQLVFICTGNSARSPFAAAWWNRNAARPTGVPATSAGTKPAASVPPPAAETAKGLGVDLSNHGPKPMENVPASSTTIVLCDRAHEALSGVVEGELHHWSIPNPGGTGTARAYDLAFREISERVDLLSARLRKAQ